MNKLLIPKFRGKQLEIEKLCRDGYTTKDIALKFNQTPQRMSYIMHGLGISLMRLRHEGFNSKIG